MLKFGVIPYLLRRLSVVGGVTAGRVAAVMAATKTGISAWPMMRRRIVRLSSIPAAIQRFFMVPSRQCFTRPVVVRVMEIIDSMQFVFVNHRRSRPPTPRRATVNMSSRPLAPRRRDAWRRAGGQAPGTA